MDWNLADPHRRHKLIAAAIVAAGVIAAVAIYVKAENEPPLPMEFSTTSKQFRHELEVFGGTANVLAAQFMDWFRSLWHGTSLAYTVAVLAVATSLGYLFVTEVLLAEPPFDESEDLQAPRN